MDFEVPIIETQQLTKEFRLPLKSPGFAGAVKHLFRPKHRTLLAVDHVDIAIEEGESVGYAAPLAGPLVTAAAALVWRTALRSYQGTGS
jgi:hypothetical protein